MEMKRRERESLFMVYVCVCVCVCARACVHVHTRVHVLDREGSRVFATTSSSTDSLVSDLADLLVSVTHICHLRGHTLFCKMCCTGLALVLFQLPCSAESQTQCPLHCCWGTTWSERSPTFAAQLHLPAHDLFWANLRVQLHLPPLDLKWVCRYLNTVYMNTWFASPLLRNQLVWPSVASKLFRQTQVPICFGSLVSLKRVQYVNGHIVLCRPPPPPPPTHTHPPTQVNGTSEWCISNTHLYICLSDTH